MKKKILVILCLGITGFLSAQEVSTLNTHDWSTLKYSGFYESLTSSSANTPNKDFDYFWGINIAHSANKATSSKPYYWGGQIAFGINRTNTYPAMFIRSTTEAGLGLWTKVITQNGNQSILGELGIAQNIYAGNNIRLSNGELTYVLNDEFTYDNKKMGNYAMKWVYDSWNSSVPSLWLSGLGGIKIFAAGKPRFTINPAGDVGIGTNNPKYNLEVAGIMGADKIIANTLNSNGDINISGIVNSSNLQPNSLKSVLARLPEGNELGDGTLLGVYSYNTQPADAKSFAIEHRYFGKTNSSINFNRGGGMLGGTIDISVNNGAQIARFHEKGLEVKGKIRAEEVVIEVDWADFVFNSDYKLRSLEEVEAHIEEYKHLPEIPSEAEVKANGVSLGEMQSKLLQKIEELTLYVIKQDKEIQELKNKLKDIER